MDLDVDNDLDVLLVPPSGVVQAFLQTAGELSLPDALSIPARDDAAAGDLDLDGDPDFVQTGFISPCIAVWRNRWADLGEVRFDPTSLIAATRCPAANPLLLDWDLDGDLDLLTASSGGGPWRAFRNEVRPSGHLTFVEVTAVLGGGLLETLSGVSDAVAADVDGDRYSEVIAVGPSGPVLLRNLSGAGFTEEAATRGLLPEAARAVAASDLDLDGWTDLVVLADGVTRLYRNTGGGRFLEVGAASGIPALAEPADVIATDFSFDGFPDLVMTSRRDGEEIVALLSKGRRDGPSFSQADPLLAAAPGAPLDSAMDARRLAVAVVTAAPSTPISAAAHLAHAPDADCDGIPDAFESSSGLDALDPNDLARDPDADLLPSYLEYRLGLLPQTPVTQEIGPDERLAAALLDLDGDSFDAARDNCGTASNSSQADADADGLGDACDPTPDGTVELGVPVPVMEYAQAGALGDHRFFGDRDRFRQEAEALRGYFYQGAEFRWFPHAAPGLEPVYEVLDGRFHQYLLASELPQSSEATVVGYTAATCSFAGRPGLVPLLRFVQDCGATVLTTSHKRAGRLRRTAFQELAPLGCVPPLEGQQRLVRVAELEAEAPGGAPRFAYTIYPDLETNVAGYTSRGEVFRIFEFPTPRTAPLYRLTHSESRDQILTLDAAERDGAVAAGYRDEGVLGFVLTAPPAGSPVTVLALQRLRLSGGGHVYTVDRDRFEELIAAGHRPEGTEGWVVELRPTPGAPAAGRCVPAAGTTPAVDGARKLVSMLQEIPDPTARAATAAGVFNALCAVNRAMAGVPDADNIGEQRVAEALEEADPESRRRLAAAGRELEDITPVERADLLGPLGAYDPGACEAEPALFTDFVQHVEEAAFNARLRTHFCPDTRLPYPGATNPAIDRAERAITVGSDKVTSGGTAILEFGIPRALPVILGIFHAGDPSAVTASKELAEDYEKNRHPPGDLDLHGDGYYPFGIKTALPCSAAAPESCSRIDGQICGALLGRADRCYAFPVVRRGKPFYVKGYNFWDPDDARLRLQPLGPGSPTIVRLVNNPPQLKGVVPGESIAPADAPLVCQAPSPTLPGVANSENSAAFQIPPGMAEGFYSLAMFNHNGTFLRQGESGAGSVPLVPCAPGELPPCGRRTIHVCYRQPDGGAVLPRGADGAEIPVCAPGIPEPCTNVDCTPPGDDLATPAVDERSCQRDGLDACPTGTWRTPPRPLSQCRVLFSADPADTPSCGETPEWFGSRGTPIVFVSDEPLFELQAQLTKVHCSEESGWDILGEDEASVVFVAVSEDMARRGLNPGQVEDLGQTWNGDFDSGTTRRVEPPRTMGRATKVALDDPVAFGLQLIERDSKPWIIAIGSIVIVVAVLVAAAIACSLGGPAVCIALTLGTRIAIASLLVAIFIGVVLASDVDDDMGATFFDGTGREFGPRITAVHLPDFRDNLAYQTDPGPLPKSEFPKDNGTVETALTQPADLAGTAQIGFGENIDIEHDGGDTHYDVEFLFRRLRCVEPPARPRGPLETVCPAPGGGRLQRP